MRILNRLIAAVLVATLVLDARLAQGSAVFLNRPPEIASLDLLKSQALTVRLTFYFHGNRGATLAAYDTEKRALATRRWFVSILGLASAGVSSAQTRAPVQRSTVITGGAWIKMSDHLEDLRGKTPTQVAQALRSMGNPTYWQPIVGEEAAGVTGLVGVFLNRARDDVGRLGLTWESLMPFEQLGFLSRRVTTNFWFATFNDPAQAGRREKIFIEYLLPMLLGEQDDVLLLKRRLLAARQRFNPPSVLAVGPQLIQVLAILSTARSGVVAPARTLMQEALTSYRVAPDTPPNDPIFLASDRAWDQLKDALWNAGYALYYTRSKGQQMGGAMGAVIWALDSRTVVRHQNGIGVGSDFIWGAMPPGTHTDTVAGYTQLREHRSMADKKAARKFGEQAATLMKATTPPERAKITYFGYGHEVLRRILLRSYPQADASAIANSKYYDVMTHEFFHQWIYDTELVLTDPSLLDYFVHAVGQEDALNHFHEYLTSAGAMSYSKAPLLHLYLLGDFLPGGSQAPRVGLERMANRLIRDFLHTLGSQDPAITAIRDKNGILTQQDVTPLLEALLKYPDDQLRAAAGQLVKGPSAIMPPPPPMTLPPAPPGRAAVEAPRPSRRAWIRRVTAIATGVCFVVATWVSEGRATAQVFWMQQKGSPPMAFQKKAPPIMTDDQWVHSPEYFQAEQDARKAILQLAEIVKIIVQHNPDRARSMVRELLGDSPANTIFDRALRFARTTLFARVNQNQSEQDLEQSASTLLFGWTSAAREFLPLADAAMTRANPAQANLILTARYLAQLAVSHAEHPRDPRALAELVLKVIEETEVGVTPSFLPPLGRNREAPAHPQEAVLRHSA